MQQAPSRNSYDIVIVGGAIMGSSTGFFLSDNADFDGSVLVVERDASYEWCSTAHTNSCIRQQYSEELNVRISQFAADFIKNLRTYMGGDERVPELSIRDFGYLYLANSEGFANTLRENLEVQRAAGAGTVLMTADEIKQKWPFYHVDDIVLGSINTLDEGYWDGSVVFDWFRRIARERGIEYVENEVVAMTRDGARITSVTLASGEEISCGQVVNASGPRAARTAAMAGLEVPVEPRKRYSWIFSAEHPIEGDLPLTIDPSGFHLRKYSGDSYLAGGHSQIDPAADFDDFTMDLTLWEEEAWPAIATRIPQFEAIKVTHEWTGHYAYNTFDHNAIIGPHPDVENFVFLNGFSGHGLQQSPAMGRATAEWLVYQEYRTLDLSPFRYDRIVQNRPIVEKAVI